ncbi:acyl-CoA thioesterase [Luteibaculum oceani]|uniref:Acyl-CoA thioesterase n=1 Tax=Luteibaculum oceani TaxID=1294296 RepID=A0A5C6V2R5_9FLAO|nr:acyl-CoA thioesterase [Luteibaculum oceani]TXC78951.1 acyl-CoA thioesterase [Luteibaculum oceani]
MKKKILAKDTLVITSKIVLPNDTNTLGNLFGGQLLAWMDNCAAIAAGRFCRRVVVTASVGNVSFNHPIKLADVVTLEAKVSRSFSSSMEVVIDVFTDGIGNNERKKCATGIYNFVAVDQHGSTIEVPELVPETDLEKERHKAALRRKQLSLILAGKLNPEKATELKALFFSEGNQAK